MFQKSEYAIYKRSSILRVPSPSYNKNGLSQGWKCFLLQTSIAMYVTIFFLHLE